MAIVSAKGPKLLFTSGRLEYSLCAQLGGESSSMTWLAFPPSVAVILAMVPRSITHDIFVSSVTE